MRYALTAAEITAAEQAVVARGLATLDALMARAGGELAAEVARRAPEGVIAIVTGKGNNGGDGWVAARALAGRGRAVRVVACAPPEELAGPAAVAAHTAVRAGVRWLDAREAAALRGGLDGATAVVDAVFGVGFSGIARGPFAGAISAIGEVREAGALVVSADVPSGVDADTGAVAGPAVRADVTVTFSALKPGLLCYPGAGHAGDIAVAGVGVPEALLGGPASLEVPEAGDYRALLPVISRDAHKGTRGRVVVVAGSARFGGAAVLAAAGAARMGAGYTIAAVPAPVVPVVQCALPHVIAAGLATAADGSLDAESISDLARLVAAADAVVLGPGLSTSPGAAAVVRHLAGLVTCPLVLDADALNALAAEGGLPALEARTAPTLITPHPGEAARLLGTTSDAVQADRVAAARALAGPERVCVLKGARTIVAGERRIAVTLAGNPGMATAGTGDVLAGMLGTLLAQGIEPYEAGMLGAHLHGRAGDHAAAALTETCLTASDLPDALPQAVAELLGTSAHALG